jgi:hypothetical protein
MTASLFRTKISFRADLTVAAIDFLSGQAPSMYAEVAELWLVYATESGAAPRTVQVLGPPAPAVPGRWRPAVRSVVLESGGSGRWPTRWRRWRRWPSTSSSTAASLPFWLNNHETE